MVLREWQPVDRRVIDHAQFVVNRAGENTQALKIAHSCKADDIKFMPRAGVMHDYHLAHTTEAAPFSENLPRVSAEAADEPIWFRFEDEPEVMDGLRLKSSLNFRLHT